MSLQKDINKKLDQILDVKAELIKLKKDLSSGASMKNIQTGKKHAGYDCFVFKKSAYSKFILGHIVIGINWIDEILLRNVLTFACNPIVLQSPYMTFHMGDDLIWKDRDYTDQRKFNQLEAYALMDELANYKLSV